MRKIFLSLLLILFVFLFSRLVLEPRDIYIKLFWIDIPMHILGGFVWSYLFINLNSYFKFNFKIKHILFFVLLIAIIWEIYEIITGVANLNILDSKYGIPDTLQDITFGLFGAFLACKIFYSHRRLSK
jgi:hypothetical protein